MLAGTKIDPIDTIQELAHATNVQPMLIKDSIIYDELINFSSEDVRKIVTKMQYLPVFDYNEGFRTLATPSRLAWIDSSVFMSCGSLRYGPQTFFLPVAESSNTFYDDFFAIPLAKRSPLKEPFDRALRRLFDIGQFQVWLSRSLWDAENFNAMIAEDEDDTSESEFKSVNMDTVNELFYVLLGGVVVSVGMVCLEKVVFTIKGPSLNSARVFNRRRRRLRMIKGVYRYYDITLSHG